MTMKLTLCRGLAALALTACLLSQPALANVNVFLQPTNQVVFAGSNAVITATVNTTAGETVTSYAWLKFTDPAGPYYPLAGQTTATCTLTNLQASDAAAYFVRITYHTVSSGDFSLSSTAASLIVRDPARILSQPTNVTAVAGTSAAFNATAGGLPPPVYQWRHNGTNLSEGGRYTGVTGSNLTVAGLVAEDAGGYDLVVTNSSGSSTSQVAMLTVLIPPFFSVQPQSWSVILGQDTAVSATVGGTTPLTWQWRKNGSNLADGGRWGGTTSDTLTLAAATTNDAGDYSVVISNVVGSLVSTTATLTVLVPPTITSSLNATGRQGLFFTYTATAKGTDPITFGADVLPEGLTLIPTNGLLSGIPEVMGITNLTLYATNAAGTNSVILTLTLRSGAPVITGPLSVNGKQGLSLTNQIRATNTNNPTTFGATNLPAGLTLDPLTGLITGAPLDPGVFPATIMAENKYGSDTNVLTYNIATAVPGITNALAVTGKQGQSFTFQIKATNQPTAFSATDLPSGLICNPLTGLISGPLLVAGVFPVTITAGNPYGTGTNILTLTVGSAVPVITSALTAGGVENQTNFTYLIQASNAPTGFGAVGLPLGLTANPTNGLISGTPTYGGTNQVLIWANNAYGTGSNLLQVQVAYAPITGLVVSDVTNYYSSPYLLDFSFSLRDSADPAVAQAVVRPAALLNVVCMENGLPIPDETAYVSGFGSSSKLLKTFLVLDYTYSMFLIPDAIDNMETAAADLIAQEPASAQFGLYEFHADYVDPTLVTNFMADKPALAAAIHGIRTNYVKDNYAGTRCWDAVYAALGQFGANTPAEQRYLIVMTDGNDDSSLLNTNDSPLDVIVSLAQTNAVKIYCVAFGDNINLPAIQQLTEQTGGRYFLAASAGDLLTQFALLLKDIRAQYLVRWATLKRANKVFQPSFQVTVDGFSALLTNLPAYVTNYITNIDDTVTPPKTNIDSSIATNNTVPPYNPPDWAGNVNVGALRLVANAGTNASAVMLHADYVPRFVRQIRLHYRANYACTPSLASAGPGDILSGWTLSSTNDGAGGQWLTLSSSNPADLLSSLPYGVMGDLVNFQFQFPDLLLAQQTFSVFELDNTIYSNMPPGNQSFTLTNTAFVTVYPEPPPYGTPIPWLNTYGVTTNYDTAELSDPTGKGLPLWQQYLAGLNPLDTNSTFVVLPPQALVPGQPPQITFTTVLGRYYSVESGTILGSWVTFVEGIAGTGGTVTVTDHRNLVGAQNLFYRVVVH